MRLTLVNHHTHAEERRTPECTEARFGKHLQWFFVYDSSLEKEHWNEVEGTI